MAGTAAARRYARALFALAREDSRVAPVREEIDRIANLLLEMPELRDALFRPLHPVAERRAALAGVAKHLEGDAVVVNFCAFLVDQRRVIDFAAIRAEYARLADEAAGRVQAEVRSAGPLDEGQQERLRRALSARSGRDVELSVEVDGSLIGGVVAKVGDRVFDGSLRTQLGNLRENLLKG